ncbi:MAG: hypothetical protein V3U82_05350 [Robiginitomaculum sp.]
MGGFVRGDVIFSHQGKPYYLRLTLGALAEICAFCDCNNPAGLAKVLRGAEPEVIIKFITALARPAHGNLEFKNLNMAEVMAGLADVFERAFAPLSKGESGDE